MPNRDPDQRRGFVPKVIIGSLMITAIIVWIVVRYGPDLAVQ